MGIPRPHTRKRARIRRLVLLVLVVVAAIVATVIELSSGIRSEINQSLMRGTADRAETAFRDRLDRLFEPLQGHLAVVERWGERGALDLNDHRSLNDLFIPMLDQFPWVTSMMIATDQGIEYMLLEEDTTWVTRETDAGAHPGRVHWRRWSAVARDSDSLLADWWEDLDYDPRRRPWFRAAFETAPDERGIYWTRPYAFFTTKQIGVTLSRKWRTRAGEGTHVAGVDVPLDEILDFADKLVDERNGYSFLLNSDRDVVAGGDDVDDARVARDPTAFEAEILTAWRSAGGGVEAPLALFVDGARWWADFRSVSNDTTPLWLAVAVPESSFAGQVRGRQHQFVFVVAGFLLVGVLLTVLGTQVRRVREGEVGLDLASEHAILDLIAQGEGDKLEFKSTLRWNINADKPGKEVEISWLKTVVAFLNTDGGVLAIGVNDDGEVTGIEADRFANDDKFLLHYHNLVKEHVGLEFTQYIQTDIVPVRGKKMFVLQCEKSAEPAFLRKGKEEQFYVRIGPSSRQLSMSQVVERLGKGRRGRK
jgi:hypothetical protein